MTSAWVIAADDGSHVYGPFGTEAAAKTGLPDALEQAGWRVVALEDPAALVDEAPSDLPAITLGKTLEERAAKDETMAALVKQYGSLEAVPAPNGVVFAFAKAERERLQASVEYWDSVVEGFWRRFGIVGYVISMTRADGRAMHAVAKQSKQDLIAVEQLERRHVPAS